MFAAAINGGGVLEVAVTVRTTDSTLARIVHIVEEAQERKGQSQRLAERIARPLVPGIMVLAAAVAVVGSVAGDPHLWIGRALVVLVAAAPCAFAISVPVTVVAAVGAAARMGALVKGGAALEALAGVRVVALDKTGTLSRNEPMVVDVIAADGEDREGVLRVAAALEARSEHPLAAAILAAAPNGSEASDVQAVTGSGLIGMLDGRQARLGKPGFIAAGELHHAVEALQAQGSTVVLVEHDSRLLGAVAVRDELRPEAADVVAELRRLGIRRIAMLTGDSSRTASALGQQAALDDVHAELLPEDKVRIVEELRVHGPVAMVGGGINDAPALASADVGVAMGAMGSDVAIETADVALMGESLNHLPEVLRHARHAGRIMRQNVALSAAIIGVLIPLAAFGVLGLATVVATHELAEIVVIANGIRAGRRSVAAPVDGLSPTEPTARASWSPDKRGNDNDGRQRLPDLQPPPFGRAARSVNLLAAGILPCVADVSVEEIAESAADPDDAIESDRWSWATPTRLVVLGLALMFLAGVVGYRIGLPDHPSADSVEVGFLQDMIVHHQQAVTMSFRTAEAATDPVVRHFAKEIILLQEYEIGLMDAWLGRWGHPRESDSPTAMGWAGMAHPKAFMPGMATEQDLEALDTANGLDIDDRFLRMMMAHHSGGVAMAEAYLERGDDAKVRELAGRILKNQRVEISEMQYARTRIGLPPAPIEDFSADHQPPGSGTSPTSGHRP